MSTKRKKRSESERTSPLTDKGYRLSYDPTLIGHYGRGGKSALDIEFESEDAMYARSLKEGRVEELNLKRRARVVKLQKEIDKLEKEGESMDSNSSDLPRISLAMAQQIANLPPEERDKVIETYAMFSSIAKGKGDSMLPLLIGFSKSNPGTPQINMLDYAKAMGDQLKTGIDLAKAFTEKEKPSNAMEFMKVMKDLIIEGVRNPLLQAIEKTQPQPSAFEQILLNPDMRAAAKEMGMFGGNDPKTGSTNEMDLKIEQLRGERELSGRKIDLEYRKMNLEREANDRRTDMILGAIGPLATVLSGPISEGMQRLGQQHGAAHMPPGVVPPPSNALQIICSCGYQGIVPYTGAETINCPKCGQNLEVRGPPDDPGKPENAD